MLWLHHVNACADYHARRAAAGIPEPPRLDPLCGAAALAASVRGLGLPSDRAHILSVCHINGQGSSLADLEAAAGKLGLHAYGVQADDVGLQRLPKPLIAHVEQDHFVAVVRADKRGVSYLCSDCGPWPGGAVNLTWRQWHLMDAGLYGVVAQPGSVWDGVLAGLPSGRPAPSSLPAGLPSWSAFAAQMPPVQVALRPGFGGGLGLARRERSLLPALRGLRGHVVLVVSGGSGYCDRSVTSMHCVNVPAPMDSNGPTNTPRFAAGATGGDPVNLATGEEEYTPAPDLTVYNPHGPSVVWQRFYNSLRGPLYHGDLTYNNGTDFGNSWSQTYDVGVFDPGIATIPQVAQGGTASIKAVYYSPSSSNGPSWQVLSANYSSIASDTTSDGPGPNGWSVSSPDNGRTLTVSAPSSAGITSNGDHIRLDDGSTFNVQSTINVVAAGGANGDTTAIGQANPKYVYLPNGGRIPFTASSYPSAIQPSVSCTVASGYPILVTWNYIPNDQAGSYTVTFSDRTKWITLRTDSVFQSSVLGQIVDRNGNAIVLNYDYLPALSTSGHIRNAFLASITNSGTGQTLLTVSRDNSQFITQVSDCYGRSVTYGMGTYINRSYAVASNVMLGCLRYRRIASRMRFALAA